MLTFYSTIAAYPNVGVTQGGSTMKYFMLKDPKELNNIKEMMEEGIRFKDIASHYDVESDRVSSFYVAVRKSLEKAGMWGKKGQQ
jgi:hypothetical protein